MKSSSSFISGLFIGAAIGATLGILYAPQSGKETRAKLRAKIAEMELDIVLFRQMATEKGGELERLLQQKIANLEAMVQKLSQQMNGTQNADSENI